MIKNVFRKRSSSALVMKYALTVHLRNAEIIRESTCLTIVYRAVRCVQRTVCTPAVVSSNAAGELNFIEFGSWLLFQNSFLEIQKSETRTLSN